MTTTNEDLRHALNRLTNAMRAADIPTEHLHVQHGSKTYGRAFRLYYRDPQSGGLATVPSAPNYLGMTKREAVDTIDAVAQGIWMVVNADVQANR